MQLSKRLYAVASFVTQDSVVADIGCDHAYTSIYLAENKIARHIIAADINAGPVSIAKDDIKTHNLQQYIDVRQSDGLMGICEEDNVDTILISGMGGNLIIDILRSNKPVMENVRELILQPQSDICRVRHFLHDTGFKIINEKMLLDNEKFYTIIKAVKGTQTFDKEYEYIYGKYLIDNCDETLECYLRKLYASNMNIINSLSDSDSDIHIQRCRQLLDNNKIVSDLLEKTAIRRQI